MPRTGKRVRPINSPGVRGKFRRVLPTKKRIASFPPHRLVVIGDLRVGSLRSLDRYLKKHRGIPDREVALELRKLLSGTSKRTRFRLAVIDHPDLPPDKGGRPNAKHHALTRVERELYAKYRQQLEAIGKTKEARFQTAKNEGRSEITVRRAIKNVEAALKSEIEWEDLFARRQARLDRLRTER